MLGFSWTLNIGTQEKVGNWKGSSIRVQELWGTIKKNGPHTQKVYLLTSAVQCMIPV